MNSDVVVGLISELLKLALVLSLPLLRDSGSFGTIGTIVVPRPYKRADRFRSSKRLRSPARAVRDGPKR